MVRIVPNFDERAHIIGAGIAPDGESQPEDALADTPISLVLGSLICLYLNVLVSSGPDRAPAITRKIVNYGTVLAC